MLGDELIEAILAGEEGRGNELLSEFHRGYPIENVRRLLVSDVPEAVKAGTWVLSELGRSATPFLGDIALLLDHPLRYVRFFAADAVLTAAGPEHGEVIAKAINLLGDVDEAVRWKGLRFLTTATREQLAAARPHLNLRVRTDVFEWLIDARSAELEQLLTHLESGDSLSRSLAVAATARLCRAGFALLKHAASSSDGEIAKFAQEELSHLKKQ